MRNYIIQPCYTKSQEQQGYNVTCKYDKWKASHSAIELCETAVLRREHRIGKDLNKHQVYGKDYQITYKDCTSETGISEARLALYR